jgi:hypothetical protein
MRLQVMFGGLSGESMRSWCTGNETRRRSPGFEGAFGSKACVAATGALDRTGIWSKEGVSGADVEGEDWIVLLCVGDDWAFGARIGSAWETGPLAREVLSIGVIVVVGGGAGDSVCISRMSWDDDVGESRSVGSFPLCTPYLVSLYWRSRGSVLTGYSGTAPRKDSVLRSNFLSL